MGRRWLHGQGPHGVNTKTVCPSYRLRDLLQLGNNPILFREFKKQLYDIAQKHLDLNDAPRDRRQVKRWNAIETELRSTFPDIFDCEDGETCLDLATRMLTAYHHRRRFALKHQLQPVELLNKRSLVMSVSVPTTAALRKTQLKEIKKEKENEIDDHDKYEEKPKVQQPKLAQMMDISNLSIKVASSSTSPLTPRNSGLRSSAAITESQRTPLHAESSSQAQSSTNANFNQGKPEDAFQLTGVTQVARFLNACFPPMAHFLHRFIDYGCSNEQYLAAVSTWPSDKISYFLSQVSARTGDAREFSQMEMLILQNHFTSYFNKAQT